MLQLSPLPPSPSGVADYAADLTSELRQRVRLSLAVADDAPAPGVPFLRASELARGRERFDVPLYQIGNHRLHAWQLQHAARWPGVVVLHDAVLHHLHADWLLARGNGGGYVREAAYGGGFMAARRARDAALGVAEPGWYDEPMIARLVRGARLTIVHSKWARGEVLRADPAARVEVVHHGVGPTEDVPEPDGAFTVGVFGGLTPEKRVMSVVRAVERLPGVRLLLVGEPSPALPPVEATGRVSLADMERLMRQCHVCVQLRWPTAGEASGATLRALRLGRPTVVSDAGWFAELPEDAVTRVPAGTTEGAEITAVVETLARLRDSPTERARLSAGARSYASASGWPAAAERYARLLGEVA